MLMVSAPEHKRKDTVPYLYLREETQSSEVYAPVGEQEVGCMVTCLVLMGDNTIHVHSSL